jgi:chromosome segregation ATPase
MSGNSRSSGWSTGKVLAVVIPVCVVVAAVAVTLILVLGGGNKSTTSSTTPTAKAPTEEEVVNTYDDIKKEADTALQQIAALESQQAMADAAAYQAAVEQAGATITDLATDVESASAAVEAASGEVSQAAGEVTETQQQYQQLLTETQAYYDYVAQLSKQASEQVQYIKSTVPTLQQVDQMASAVTGVQQAPTPVQRRTLGAQLISRASGISTRARSAKTAPESLSQYSASLQALGGQVSGYAQQMTQALAAGNNASFDQLAGQMNSSIQGTLQQLSGGISTTVNSFNSQLASLGQKVESAIPKK